MKTKHAKYECSVVSISEYVTLVKNSGRVDLKKVRGQGQGQVMKTI